MHGHAPLATWVYVLGILELVPFEKNANKVALSCDRQAVWRQHWDFQLAKALECQFRQGLASLTKALPEVRTGAARLMMLSRPDCVFCDVTRSRLCKSCGCCIAFCAWPWS